MKRPFHDAGQVLGPIDTIDPLTEGPVDLVLIGIHVQIHFLVRMPAEVIAFLQACAEGGATLELLTAEVSKWLAHHSLESQFRIRMVPG